MENLIKNNKVKVNSNGKFLLTGLSNEAKKSLNEKRNDLCKKVDISVVDQYIIALYDKDANDVYFVDENSYSSDERAELI